MRILVSNDDGYLAPGIQVLRDALSAVGSTAVVAPDRNRSAASHSLTLRQPISVHRHSDALYSVEGTPTDCVNLALSGLLDDEPDMVVSGINDGPNMGDDVLYSGTVAAAIEGRHLGHPAIAVSMASHNPKHFDTAAKAVVAIIEHMDKVPMPADTILNVNVPDVSWEQIQGMRATRLGNRHPSNNATKELTPRGDAMFWIGPAGDVSDASPGTDFHAVEQGFVSITPLQIDLTRFNAMQSLSDWLEHL